MILVFSRIFGYSEIQIYIGSNFLDQNPKFLDVMAQDTTQKPDAAAFVTFGGPGTRHCAFHWHGLLIRSSGKTIQITFRSKDLCNELELAVKDARKGRDKRVRRQFAATMTIAWQRYE